VMSTSLAGGSTALADPPPGIDDEFALDVKVVLATHPNGKLQCSTSDGCGSTCNDGASACNSSIEPPLS